MICLMDSPAALHRLEGEEDFLSALSRNSIFDAQKA